MSFPVPDGDTGINMYHTLKRAYEEIEPLDSDDISLIAKEICTWGVDGGAGQQWHDFIATA